MKANKEKAAAEKRERDRIRQQQATTSASGSAATSLGYASASNSLVSGGIGVGTGAAGMHIGGGSDGDLCLAMGGSGPLGGRSHIEPPKDRNQLAIMRVIRRNLVYAVGLPPSIATEETLRKPEYFGQYGKIAKIVLNRNHNGNGDPRRASASAYVTFVHKEDTLACILALDGFYLDGRNVRASYGTSKYCSAFIKNVRCNNPDCTYLHCMGDTEDTFTKQEIQAGYVTSGRDVLARQQQLAAAQASSSGGGSGSRRKVGGGGPSGTGKAPSNPVFPPPCFDESPKVSSSGFSNMSSSASGGFSGVNQAPLGRSSSAGAGFSAVAAASTSAPPGGSLVGSKVVRSSSMSVSGSVGAQQPPGVVVGAPPTSSVVSGLASSAIGKTSAQTGQEAGAPQTTSEKLARHQEQLRRMYPQNKGTIGSSGSSGAGLPSASSVVGQKKSAGSAGSGHLNLNGSSGAPTTVGGAPMAVSGAGLGSAQASSAPVAATAASVVAGVHHPAGSLSSSNSTSVQPPPHTTLTPLTPLKRPSSRSVPTKGSSAVGTAVGGKSSFVANSASGAANFSSSAVPPSGSGSGVDNVQLPPNLPVPKGLTPAERAALLEQRKEAMAAMARQQREMAMKLTALRSSGGNPVNVGNVGQKNSGGAIPGAVGTASSSPSSSVSSSSGLETTVPSLKTTSTANTDQDVASVGAIGGTVIGSSSPSNAGAVGPGAGSSSIGQRTNGNAFLPAGMGGLRGVTNTGTNTTGPQNSSVIGGPPSSLSLGSIGSVSSVYTGGRGGQLTSRDTVGMSHGSNSLKSNSVGADVFASQTPSNMSTLLGKTVPDSWGANSQTQENRGSAGLFGSSGGLGYNGGGIWGSDNASTAAGSTSVGTPGTVGAGLPSTNIVTGDTSRGTVGRVIGEGTSRHVSAVHGAVGGGNLLGSNPFASSTGSNNSGSSALASMLGIDLPTGSGSLRESTTLWDASPPSQGCIGRPNGSGGVGATPGVIGGQKSGIEPVGGLAIGTRNTVPIGGFSANNHTTQNEGNNNDIALLQSLLPGVHITSGNAHQPAAPSTTSGGIGVVGGGGWDSSRIPTTPSTQQHRASLPVRVGIGGLNIHQQQGSSDTWGGSGLYSSAHGVPGGMGGQNAAQQSQQQEQRQSSIW